ncbi:MAG TPA: HAD-IA family hydrolase [Bryobacteraceae bacterium]|nr:HAD-IA family hydrolase [Bryobacteraceae bacterium]
MSALAAPRKPQRAIRLVVLDVGGTIIEDQGDVPEALRTSMDLHGIRSSREEIGRRRGASKREVIRYFVDQQSPPPNVDRGKLTAAIHDEFTAKLIEVYRSVPPIAGAGETIRQLRASGYLVAATTGFDRTITTSIFQRLGWERDFAAIICSDDVAQGRPAPFMIFHAMESAGVNSVAEVVAVGDTALDLQAGTNAGVRAVVGVLTGAATSESLRKEPHTHILSSVADLPGLLASKL